MLGLAAVVSPSRALALTVGLLFVAIVFRSLAAGVVLFSAMVFFEALPGASGAGLSLIKVAGAVLAAAWLLALADRRTRTPTLFRDRPVLSGALIAFIGWSVISSVWATSSGAALSASLRMGQGILLFFVVYTAIQERRHLRWVMLAYVAGAAVTAIIGVAGATGADSADTGGRLAGSIGDPNYFAALLVPALAFASFMLVTEHSALVRWFLGISAAISAAALFLAASRGGIVALGAMVIAVIALAGPVRTRALAFVSCLTGIGVAYFVLVAPPETLSRITEFSSSGSSGRTDLWSIGVRMFLNHPLLGVGADNFILVEPSYVASNLNLSSIALVFDTPHVAHNTYLQVATELGIVGLVVFALVILATIRAGVIAFRTAALAGDSELEVLARALVIGLIGLLAAYAFLTAEYEKQIWLVLGLVAASYSVAKRAAQETASAGGANGQQQLSTSFGTRTINDPGAPTYDLNVREQQVEQREQRVAERLQSVRDDRTQLRHERDALNEREQDLHRRSDDLEAERRTIATRAQAVAAREAALPPNADELIELEGWRRELTALAAGLEERVAALEKREQEFESTASLVLEREQALARREQELAEAERETEERLRERYEEISRRAERIEEAERSAQKQDQADTARRSPSFEEWLKGEREEAEAAREEQLRRRRH